MKTIKIELSENLSSIDVYGLADLHIGDANCNEVAIKKAVEKIANQHNAYVILNGDLINAALKTSVSDVYSETLSPMEQLLKVRDMLYPIKDKIICVTGGNHDARIWKTSGIDVCQILAKELNCEDKYSPNSAVIFLKFGTKDVQHGRKLQKMLYTIYVSHGSSGGGRTIGGKLNRLEEVTSIVDCDCYIHSHVHLPAVFKQSFYRTNLTWQSLEEVEKVFVSTNAFLDYGGYGETFEFKAPSKSLPVIHFSGRARNITVTL